MIRKILQKEDPALHKVCHPVTSFDRKLGALLDDLTATLKDAQGLGLAAPQIGWSTLSLSARKASRRDLRAA